MATIGIATPGSSFGMSFLLQGHNLMSFAFSIDCLKKIECEVLIFEKN